MGRLHIRVTGVVQGVGFRYHVERRARQFGLRGWTRNCADGSVEIDVVGAEGPLNGFVQDVRLGPPSAHVTGVAIDRYDDDPGYEGFEIRF